MTQTDSTSINRPLEPHKRAIIVGASSGIGAALAHRLAHFGYSVAVVARRQENLDALCNLINDSRPTGSQQVARAYPFDVSSANEVADLFSQIVYDMGGLDLIVYAAAVQTPVALDEYDTAKDKAMIDVNLTGAIAWLNEAAARFERGRGGHIVGISSISGGRGRIASPAYSSSKAGLNTYLESLRNRLSRHGVTVTTIIPGFVETRLLANATRTFWEISAEDAAAQIHQAVRQRRQTVYIPARWRLVMLIIKHIPSFIFRRLSF